MESWWILILIAIGSFLVLIAKSTTATTRTRLPPGPSTIPVIGSLAWLLKSFSELEPILRRLHSIHGPLVTLRIGPRPAIFVADRSLAHHALVHHGALFASRPPSTPTARVISSDQHNISAAPYGPTWRLLRRNLTSEILHPSRVSAYGPARRWVLGVLLDRLRPQAPAVNAMEHFQYAMFCLLVLMCFGDKLDHASIKDVERVQRRMLLAFGRYNILNFFPSLTKILFRNRWREFLRLRTDQESVLVPLINSRTHPDKPPLPLVPCYVDTLLTLRLPAHEGDRKLHLGEIVSLCSEFLNAGTDTTSTALQWIMANLVKHPSIQERVYAEIKEVAAPAADGDQVEVISEDDVGKMHYLKAVVLEALRRHPPGHFVLPHSVTEDVELGGYLIPTNSSINFMVAEMGWDPKVWEDPMAFKPERFLEEDGSCREDMLHNITKSSGETIKMMPFGAGRRICPGSGLALLHLQYFVANLVWNFRWTADPDYPLDLSEKQEFTVVMKHPLRARLSSWTSTT